MKTPITLLLSSFICLLFCSGGLWAQTDAEPTAEQETNASPINAKNAIYLELGGNGMFYSLNYDRVFYQKGIFRSVARVGFAVLPINISDKNYLGYIMPVEAVALLGRSNHYLELGAGMTPILSPATTRSYEREFDTYAFSAVMPFRVGYRYQKTDGGFFFRAAYTPAIQFSGRLTATTNFMALFGGLSIGTNF